MNLYKQLLEKQRLARNKSSLEYYYKNRDYVLERQAKKKLLNKKYYKEWYEKNKIELNEKRRTNKGAYKKVNKNYNKKTNSNDTPYNNQKPKKEPCFTLFL